MRSGNGNENEKERRKKKDPIFVLVFLFFFLGDKITSRKRGGKGDGNKVKEDKVGSVRFGSELEMGWEWD